MFRSLLVILILSSWGTAYGQTIEVNVTLDLIEDDGECSLREAILSANSDTSVGGCPAGQGADIIALPSGTFFLSLSGPDEDEGRTGDLDITDDLTIIGTGADSTILNGRGRDRVLQIHGETTAVRLDGLGITGGHASRGGLAQDGDDGGGIWTEGLLTIEACEIVSNRAGPGGIARPYDEGAHMQYIGGGAGGRGGGIFVSGGQTTVSQSVVCGNSAGHGELGSRTAFVRGGQGGAGGEGGGIYSRTALFINDSVVCENTSGEGAVGGYSGGSVGGDGGRGGHGAGIFSLGRAELINCVVRDNACGAGGDAGNGDNLGRGGEGGGAGGIMAFGDLLVQDTSVVGNSAGHGGDTGTWFGDKRPSLGGSGGGIVVGADSVSTISTSTIESNQAGNGGTVRSPNFVNLRGLEELGSGGHGGGVLVAPGAAMLVERSAVLGNAAGHGADLQRSQGGDGGHGGGFYVGADAQLNLRSSTLSLNTTGDGGEGARSHQDCALKAGDAGSGGGVFNMGLTSILDATIFDNRTGAPGAIDDIVVCEGIAAQGRGGGVATETSLTVANTIIASNHGSLDAPDCATLAQSSLQSSGHNLLSQAQGCLILGQTEDDIVADPLLLPAADNGGPTPTCELPPQSPAVEAGPGSCLPVDQRGLDRPSGGRCDIGAFEAVILPNRPYNDQFETLEDTALTVPAPGVLSNDTFEEASVELLEAPLNGSLSLEPNGALAYLPDGDFFGLDGFTYQANGLPARVLLRVVPVTDAPIIGRPQGVIAQRAYELQWTCVEDAHGHALAFRVEKALDASMQNMIGNREISATGQSQHGLTLHLREGSTWVRVSVITPWGEASSETIELRYTQDGEPLDAGNDSDEGSGSGDTEAGDVGERDTEDEEIAAPDDVEERDAMADEVTPDPDERVEMTRPSKQGEGCSSAPGHPYDQGGAIILLLVFLAWRPGRR